MQISEGNNVDIRFKRYNMHQRKLVNLDGTDGFTIGPLNAGTTYQYQMINYRETNIKWLSNGVLYTRTVSYDIDSQ